MKMLQKTLFLSLILLLLYFLTWPVPIDPIAWQAPKAEPLAGVFSVNHKLADFETMNIDGLHGPEAVVANTAGDIYSTTHEGWILRWTKGQTKPQRWVNVGGRPLGIAFDSTGNLWVANAYLGLQKVDIAGKVSLELTSTDGVPIRYADDLDILANGKIYFSDASTKFPAKNNGTLAASLLEIIEHAATARVIEFDPSNGQSKVIMSGLSFANGIATAADDSFILVVETGSYRVWKYWLKGDKSGQSEVIVDNLPGFPDNIHRGLNGRFWLGLTSPRNAIVDKTSAQPFLRKMIQRLPSFLRPKVVPSGHIVAINSQGKVLTSLQDPQGAYPATTGAWETKKHLYVSSLTADKLVRYDKHKLAID